MSTKTVVACLFLLPIAGAVTCGGDRSSGTAEPGTAATIDAELVDSLALPESVPTQATTEVDAGACTWSRDFNPASDEYALGCWAHSITNPCQVPGGGVVGPDGMILGPDGNPAADQSCRFACVASEFALHCVGEYTWPDSGCETRTMPAPDPSLGCRILPLPTPENQAYYCCPCGRDQASLADASVSASTLCH